MCQLVTRLLILFFLLSFTLAASAQDGRVIAAIDFEGLKQVSSAKALTASGLIVGQPFNVADIDAAAQKLLDSGLFTNLSYRTRTTGNKITITFRVEEAKAGDIPVIFDNFIWFSDDELLAAVMHEMPGFTGRAPVEGKLPETITRILQNLLDEKKIAGSVQYSGAQDLSGNTLAHVFTVTGVKMQICSFQFPGAKKVSEQTLRNTAATDLKEADYSREIVRAYAGLKLFALYRSAGQLQAKFGEPVGQPDASCKNGVAVTLPVSEGLTYSWGPTSWFGMNTFSTDQLNNFLAIKQGDIANGLNFDQGVGALLRAYRSQGYLDSRVRAAPEFDDGSTRVSYKIEIYEGPQYRMGSLFFKAFSEKEAKALRNAWRLRRGDVFDDGYFKEFIANDAPAVQQRLFEERQGLGKPALVDVKVVPNKQSLTVDVTLESVKSPD